MKRRSYRVACDTCGLVKCECVVNTKRSTGNREAAEHLNTVLIDGQFPAIEEPSVFQVLREYKFKEFLAKAS